MNVQRFELKLTSLIFFLSFLINLPPAFSEMTIHFIDVGQGGGVFIQKDGKNIEYDCGTSAAGAVVTDYLDALEVTSLDYLIVSHAHSDHMGGCLKVLKKVKVGTIYINGSKAQTATWKHFLKEAQADSNVVVIDKDLDLDGIEILVAYDSHGKRFTKEADNSILVQLVDGKVKVLLTGDCEVSCENEIDKDPAIQSDILNVGHHGSNYSSSLNFLNKVKPKIAVIQVGLGNPYGHPTKGALSRLQQVKAAIYRTDLDGSVVVHSDGKTYEVETEK